MRIKAHRENEQKVMKEDFVVLKIYSLAGNEEGEIVRSEIRMTDITVN